MSILHFSNRSGQEYIVLLDDTPKKPKEYARPGFQLTTVIEACDGVCTLGSESSLPLETELHRQD